MFQVFCVVYTSSNVWWLLVFRRIYCVQLQSQTEDSTGDAAWPWRWRHYNASKRLSISNSEHVRTLQFSPVSIILQIYHTFFRLLIVDGSYLQPLAAKVNLLKLTGYVMHQQFNIHPLYVLPTLYLYVLYLSHNKQRLVPLTSNDMIYLLTAIRLPPGGSSTVHIYTPTIHRTTQNKQYIEQHKTNNT
jgi:hypothetical protein